MIEPTNSALGIPADSGVPASRSTVGLSMPGGGAGENLFAATSLELRKLRRQSIAKYVFLSMALVLVIPVLLILTLLVIKAWPSLSFKFIIQNPADGMKAGGIWAPLVGTFCLVFLSLCVCAPIGILAGV